VALRSTLTVPLTRVPFSAQAAPCGTRRLSTVAAPIVPRQLRSSADAPAGKTAAAAATATRAVFIPARILSPSLAAGPWRSACGTNMHRKDGNGVRAA